MALRWLSKNGKKIENDEAKKALEIDEGKNAFLWHEVLGFEKAPSKREALVAFRRKARIYHPDKARNPEDKVLFGDIMVALNDAKGKGGF